MSEYAAPLQDMQFVLNELIDLDKIAALPGCQEASSDVVSAVLEEGAKFANEVLSPLNVRGDREGAKWQNGDVKCAPGWQGAYKQFCEAGWGAVSSPVEYGGQDLPRVVATPLMEMWKSANMAFGLCPMLTQGAIEALLLRGSDELKNRYLPNMVSGKWSGTMNLTEPQAGSDLSAVRTKAVPQADGSYKLFGQKIFITYGEHDLAENIVHMVLGRLPDAPEGVKGISLFLVPKFLVNNDGSIGARNDVHCVSIEHKLGIHASPTCVLAYGDRGGATGYLIGEANRGLEYMFIMMNAARFAVGMEGVAIAQRAYQKAVEYAKDRIQGFALGSKGGARVSIAHHPDVRRMLMLMKSQTEAMRALAYVVAATMDTAEHHAEQSVRDQMFAVADLLIPVVKGWCTETGVEVTSLGVQVHGGMGYIEETGAAQYFRDARITSIYEGTTAIQANDLLSRKILRDEGRTANVIGQQIKDVCAQLVQTQDPSLLAIAQALSVGVKALEEAVRYMLTTAGKNLNHAFAGSVPLLKLVGIVAGGWQMARAALIAHVRLADKTGEAAFYQAKIITTRFYADHVLMQAPGIAHSIIYGADAAVALTEAQL